MVGQSQIQRRMSEAASIDRVRQLTAENPELLRSELADRLCDEFGFEDRRARRQRSGCLKALGVLERRGLLSLPAPRSRPGPSQARRLESSVPPPLEVPEKAGDVHGLGLVLVESEEQMMLWNSLLLDEHPRGVGPLVGRQLRYLLGSEHGWLGALGFASAALHLAARDRWIGWDWETRRSHLDMVVGMSRFLIRPSVHCKNLASRVLGLAIRQMPRDFEAAYGYRPLVVESFIDTEKFSGTCYRAANWTRVGSTQGRGPQDRDNKQDGWPLDRTGVRGRASG